jgi:rhodanese-related sulfurtransferase
MTISQDEVRANRDYFAAKLRAEKQKVDVVAKVKKEAGAGDFLLLDVRQRDAFAQGHIAGALSVPLAEIPKLAATLPREKELVTYCWNHT